MSGPRRNLFLMVCMVGLLKAGAASSVTLISGVVFDDENRNREWDASEMGIESVPVSNGRDIVLTDAFGRYEIEAPEHGAIFVIKPANWATHTDDLMRPQFYYMHKPDGSPEQKYSGSDPTGELDESVNFPLFRNLEKGRFRALLFGDTQPDDQREIDFVAHDVVDELIGTDASFGVVLGDVLNDDLSLFDSLSGTMATLGMPMYYVLGNHDMNYDSPGDHLANETFEATFGPSYYSFNMAQVHFVVLDNVHWRGEVTDPDAWEGGNYIAGLGRDQLNFLSQDLRLVHPDRLVVLMMHIPFNHPWDENDKAELFRIISHRRKCMSLAAHAHYIEHDFVTAEEGWPGEDEHHQYINPTVCGSWWTGSPDEVGIPHTTMRDGSPNGSTLAFFEGPNYRLDFLPARRPASYQMNIWAPAEVHIDDRGAAEFFVNVFAGSERSKVEFRMNGESQWRPMKRFAGPDPYFAEMTATQGADSIPYGVRTPRPRNLVPHLWSAVIPEVRTPGTRVIEVREHNMWGRIHEGRRSIRFK